MGMSLIVFEDMMRKIKFVSPGDYEQFARDVVERVRESNGVEANKLAEGANQTKATDSDSSVRKSGFKFGAASRKELEGVNTTLVLVTRRALELSEQDFCVYDGLRTLKEQASHVKNGTSRTMQSKHLQGLAVDLVPWINGGPKWDWTGCYKIACAVDQAATELGVADKITWGGAWDRRLSDFGGDARAYVREVEAYSSRHPGKDFLDGPHFEIQP